MGKKPRFKDPENVVNQYGKTRAEEPVTAHRGSVTRRRDEALIAESQRVEESRRELRRGAVPTAEMEEESERLDEEYRTCKRDAIERAVAEGLTAAEELAVALGALVAGARSEHIRKSVVGAVKAEERRKVNMERYRAAHERYRKWLGAVGARKKEPRRPLFVSKGVAELDEGECMVVFNSVGGEQYIVDGPCTMELGPMDKVIYGPVGRSELPSLFLPSAGSDGGLTLAEARKKISVLKKLLSDGFIMEEEFAARKQDVLCDCAALREIEEAERAALRAKEEAELAAANPEPIVVAEQEPTAAQIKRREHAKQRRHRRAERIRLAREERMRADAASCGWYYSAASLTTASSAGSYDDQ